MRIRTLFVLLVTAGMLVLAGARPSAQSGYDLFQKALGAERADGNLPQAIELYKRVAQEFAGDRALVARALVRMAGCYAKLSDTQARGIYERVVREYPEQTAAVEEARGYLRTVEVPARVEGMAHRKVWSGPKVAPEGSVSADGRFITYPAWETGDLGLHDLVTGTDRLLTHNNYARSEYAQGSAISRDNRQVAFAWFNGTDRYQVRVVTVTPDASSEPRVVYNNADMFFLWPFDWSPDNTTVAVWLQRKDLTSQIGLLKVADGSMRILKSLDWRGPERMSFSPDGKYLAFDVPVSDADSNQRDVFVIAVDGSREHAVVQHSGHDRVMGWSPDGRTLLFASDRTGTLGLWGLPVVDGAAGGAPVMIKNEIAAISIGTTRSGALFTMARIGAQDVKTAPIDLGAGRLLAAPESAVRGIIGVNRNPQWSPDGKFLAYGSARGVSGRDRVLVIRNLDDGRMRELRLPFHYAGQFRWTPDNQAFIVVASNPNGRRGIYRIDAQTAAVTELVALTPEEGGAAFAEISPDGSKLYYWRGRSVRGMPGSHYVERDIAGGDERVVFSDRGPVFPRLSPDGKYLAGVMSDPSFKQYTVQLVTVSTGERRDIFRATETPSLALYASWTPDGQHVLVPVREKGSMQGLLVPVSGAPPQRLTFEIGQFGASFHPDGRQIAFTTGRVAAELWVLENFVAPTSASR